MRLTYCYRMRICVIQIDVHMFLDEQRFLVAAILRTQCMLSSTPYYAMPCPIYPQQHEFKTKLVSGRRTSSPLPSSRTARQTGWSGTSSSTTIP
jgi:hypothetical protein